MAFSSKIDTGSYSIGKNVKFGTYNASGVTTGTIKTGLNTILHFNDSVATAVPSTVAVLSGGTVTLTVTNGQTGTWLAVGE